MDNWIFYFLLAIGYAILYLIYRKAKQRRSSDPNCPFSDEENPFKLWEMKEQLKCKKCGKVWEIAFKRFDYVFQKITDARAKHKAKRKNCDGEVEVSGIWYEYHESPQTKKWKEYEKRFR